MGIHYFALNNNNMAFDKTVKVVLGKKPLYYKFAGEHSLKQTALNETPELKQPEKLFRAQSAVLRLFILEQLQQ